MKRFIIKILLFFAIVSVIDLSVGFIGDYLQTHAVGGYTKITDDLVRKDSHDLLIMGSSRAHHHYDTPFLSDTLGIDIYNAGVDGNGSILAVGLLELIFERYKPQLVLYDVEPNFDINVFSGDNQNKRYISNLKPYYNHAGIGEIFKDVSLEEWYKVHSGMMRYNTQIIQMLIDRYKERYSFPKGYDAAKKEPMTNEPEIKEIVAKEDHLKIMYVEKLIQICRDNDVKLALIASPKYGKTNSNELNHIKIMCNQYAIPFIDYYGHEAFNKRMDLFHDYMHLNEEGVRVYSHFIVTELESLMDIKASI